MSYSCRIFIISVPALSWLICAQIANAVVVQTKLGSVNGTTGKSRDGREFFAFYGIPFAEPPVGGLRFKPPLELKAWTGIKETQNWPPACVQSRPFGGNSTTLIGQEDCLYLNVFTPHVQVSSEKQKLPVMVYIHGGAFMGGDSRKSTPEFFMDKQIVLVTIQYRVGSFGFLGMGVDDLSGNFGLKDQTMALRWVNKNIGAFGGNAHNVTIFGCSAGAASVHLQMFVPHNNGLFHRAIMESGSAFTTWSINSRKNGRIVTTAFAVATSCYRRKIKSMLACLQELSALELVNSEYKMTVWNDEPLPFFKPMVEGEDIISASLPLAPHGESYEVKNIPWILGINSAEGAFKVAKYLSDNGKLAKEMNDNYLRYIPLVTHIAQVSDPEKLAEISEKIKVYYFGTQDIGPKTDNEMVNMLTDILFLYPLVKSVMSHKAKSFVYFYDHNNQAKKLKSYFGSYDKDLGVYHGQQVNLFFGSGYESAGKMSQDDVRISKLLIDYWTNFATYGNPNGKETDGNQVWTPSRSNEIDYLWIKTEGTSMKKGLLQDRYNFWDALPLGMNWLPPSDDKGTWKNFNTRQSTDAYLSGKSN